jgi:cytidylate kinase
MKITIFWLAWSGTSTVWKALAKELSYDFKSTWNIMREWAEEMWLSLYEFEDKIIKTDKSFDNKLDTKVVKFWENNDNFIFESRLAWNFIPDSFKIYLKCDEDERYNRIQKREWINPEIVEKNKKRESELVERYKIVYPDINFPPKDDVFELVIDVTDKLPEKIIELIIEKLNMIK